MALMAMNPDLPEHMRLILVLVPAIFMVLAALKFSAALSLYWTTTNLFSGVQAIALRAFAENRARARWADEDDSEGEIVLHYI